jgi:hypothetical protein
MSDCTTNHARLIRLEGELHPSGKDYRCDDCGDVFEVEVKPATIGVGYGEPQGESK